MNYIWFLIILISIVSAVFTGRIEAVVNAVMSGAQKAVEVAIYLAGIMAFWLGVMKIAEKAGLVAFISKLLEPVAKKLFPDVPKDNSAIGDIAMNFTANAFGLSNAATPIGIEAMKKLQNLNKDKESASNDMCTLLAMNTAGWQIVPATVIAVLAACGEKNPAVIIFPTLIVTTITFVFAIVIVKVLEKFWTPQEIGVNKNISTKDGENAND